MWSFLLPKRFFPSRSNKSQEIQNRILSLQESSNKSFKVDSPTLQELKIKRNVKRLSSVYEENLKENAAASAYLEGNTTWNICKSKSLGSLEVNESSAELSTLDSGFKSLEVDMTPSIGSKTFICKTPVQSKEPVTRLESWGQAFEEALDYIRVWQKKHDAPVSTPVEDETSKAMRKLIEMDAGYIDKMEKIILNYVCGFKNTPALRLKNDESVTNQQIEEIFGPIETIYRLHKVQFHPILEKYSHDVTNFAKTVSQMCRDGDFNVYLVYAMDEKMCSYRRTCFYKDFINNICDKIGWEYEISPVQQMARYHLLISDMLMTSKEISKSNEEIEALNAAESDFRKLMDKIYLMRNLSTKY